MELIQRKILMEDCIDRNFNSPTYGTLTATSFYINVSLMQNIDDMGMFTDIIYMTNFVGQNTQVDYTQLINKLSISGITFPFMNGIMPNVVPALNIDIRATGTTQADYYDYTNKTITASTDSKIEDVRAYGANQPYRINFNTNTETYINFSGQTINGVDRVTQLLPNPTYVFNTDVNDSNIGTLKQKSGLLYVDDTATTVTTVSYIGEGWNQTNISLSALTKEEYLFGIIFKPEVKSDVFIDRGLTVVFERHLKLSEITTLSELARYNKGYYNLTKN